MKTVALYCRVSTSKQTNENQLPELRAFAERQGWTVVKEYVDTITGSGKRKREAFDDMMDAASRHEFDLLLFWKLDRFSRAGVRQTLVYLTKLDGWNVGWRSFQEQWFDSCGPFKDAVISIMRSEEHTSELQSLRHLVCRLLLEKKECTICFVWWQYDRGNYWVEIGAAYS